MKTASALVLFSGGQDSTICLADALRRYDHVETIGFSYGQRHHVEMSCRDAIRAQIQDIAQERAWPGRLGDDQILEIPALAQIGGTALTDNTAIAMAENGLPTTFVPGRNIIFLTYAAALAYRRGLQILVGGMCETDFSGYPDCRRNTLDALTHTLTLGMDHSFTIETPLMQMDKAESWAFAHQIGGDALINLILEETHSCYEGNRQNRHEWGYGCDACPACTLRAAGYRKWAAQ